MDFALDSTNGPAGRVDAVARLGTTCRVVLRERVEARRARGEVRGARRPGAITLIRRIDEAQPFAETASLGPRCPQGCACWSSEAFGFDLHRYRIRRACGPGGCRGNRRHGWCASAAAGGARAKLAGRREKPRPSTSPMSCWYEPARRARGPIRRAADAGAVRNSRLGTNDWRAGLGRQTVSQPPFRPSAKAYPRTNL